MNIYKTQTIKLINANFKHLLIKKLDTRQLKIDMIMLWAIDLAD